MSNFYVISDLLMKGTMAGLIKWEPNGTEVRTPYNGLRRGYKTTINGIFIELTYKQIYRENFLSRPEEFYACALSVEKGSEKHVFTSNPKEIAGTTMELLEVDLSCLKICKIIEEKSILVSLGKEISSLLYK